MNCKECGRKRSWPNFKVLPKFLPGTSEKNDKNVNQYSRSPGRDLKPRPHKYEAGVLTTQPLYLVDSVAKAGSRGATIAVSTVTEAETALILAGAGDFSLNCCVRTSSGAHPASYRMATRIISTADKASRVQSW